MESTSEKEQHGKSEELEGDTARDSSIFSDDNKLSDFIFILFCALVILLTAFVVTLPHGFLFEIIRYDELAYLPGNLLKGSIVGLVFFGSFKFWSIARKRSEKRSKGISYRFAKLWFLVFIVGAGLASYMVNNNQQHGQDCVRLPRGAECEVTEESSTLISNEKIANNTIYGFLYILIPGLAGSAMGMKKRNFGTKHGF